MIKEYLKKRGGYFDFDDFYDTLLYLAGLPDKEALIREYGPIDIEAIPANEHYNGDELDSYCLQSYDREALYMEYYVFNNRYYLVNLYISMW